MAIQRFETQWGGKPLIIEVGKYAFQTNGSCTVRYADSMVLATAVMEKEAREGGDFFPLQVEYEEKLYAGGRIKSSRFMKREGRPSDDAIMTARMIDRALRPLFPDVVRHDVQVVIECLAADQENDTDMIGMVAASCAIAISDIPWAGPLAGVRVGRVDGQLVINPTFAARTKSDMDVIVSGTADKTVMIEAGAQEVPEADMYAALEFGRKHLAEPIALINQVVAAIGKKKIDAQTLTGLTEMTDADKSTRASVLAHTEEFLKTKLAPALFSGPLVTKVGRQQALAALKAELAAHLKSKSVAKDDLHWGLDEFDGIVEAAVTEAILERDQRVDGRKLDEIRTLTSEVACLPRVHGSGLFSRGETQILSIVTLGGPGDQQIVENMEGESKKRYFHHYNFPPYSVGETGRIGTPGRREIGHGGLAERALVPVLPPKETFPYTIRVVSECLGSNGSSSQGSICGSTLALMDAGVPIKAPVAGIAMGLASDEAKGRYKILTDLQDLEDGTGGMDFKIGGTRKGITSIQLDTKTSGLPPKLVEDTLNQARAGRMQILDVMEKAIPTPRADMSPLAPRIVTVKINPEKIRDVIGPGGKMINKIQDETGATIDIEQDGTVTICSNNKAGLDSAVEMVKTITREVVVGELYRGKVVRLMDFGAFVEILPGTDGLVHISELAPWRVGRVTDIVNIGDEIPVIVTEIDELGRINLSHKRAKAQLGETMTPPPGMNQSGGGFGGPRPLPRRDDRR